jgi:hypothetical protein
MEQLQPEDMKNLRLACTSVRKALDQAVEHLAVTEYELVHLSRSSFKPSRVYVVGTRNRPGLASVPPRMAECLKHVWRLELIDCGTSSALRQVIDAQHFAPETCAFTSSG